MLSSDEVVAAAAAVAAATPAPAVAVAVATVSEVVPEAESEPASSCASRSAFLLPIMREKTTPSSNNSQIGMANKVWEIISGGVSSMPTTKEPTII